MKRALIPIAAFASLMCAPAIASETPRPAEASIPFLNSGAIHDWAPDGSKAVYLQDMRRKWYHATFMAPCTELPFAETIGIETRGPDTLDKFGTILVRHERCTMQSLVASSPPPKKIKKKSQPDHH